MHLKQGKGTLRRHLFVHFMLVAIFACIVLGVYYYITEQRMLKKTQERENAQAIAYATVQIQESALRVEEFANQICNNPIVYTLLSQTDTAFHADTLTIVEELDNQFQFITITEDVLALFLVGENGLDIRHGKEAALADYNAVKQTFCNPSYYPNGVLGRWGANQKNFCRFSQYAAVLPYCRKIIDTDSGQPIGYLVLLLRESVFTDALYTAIEQKGGGFCLTDKAGQPIISNTVWQQFIAQQNSSPMEIAGLQNHSAAVLSFQHIVDAYQWKLSAMIPIHQMTQQVQLLQSATGLVIVLTLILALFLSTAFSRQLTRPIQDMVETVEDIAHGNFERELESVGSLELRKLAVSIEKMQGDLKQLLHSRIAQEEERRTAEIQMLKAQINPHFLYNTLNSIKMMAVMQGVHGIQNMAEALGNILRASLSDVDELTTLREELALSEQYIYIQNIRYKGNIEYQTEVQDVSLLDFRLQRFLLQPLLENAVFHGIECGNHCGGEICVSVWMESDSLYISVQDNGAGIPPDKLKQLMQGERLSSHSIGVYNVSQRLRMTYGKAYGLQFESEPDVFTRVTARLKYCGEDKGNEKATHPDC